MCKDWPALAPITGKRSIKIEKKEEKEKQSISDLWDNISWPNLCPIGVPEDGGRDRKKYVRMYYLKCPKFNKTYKSKFKEANNSQQNTSKEMHIKAYQNQIPKNHIIERKS